MSQKYTDKEIHYLGASYALGVLNDEEKAEFEDPDRKYSTVLVDMDAGATFPDHVHAETEECYIIEGELSMGGKTFAKGDYIRAEAHSVHESISTETGCFLLVQASQENEVLPIG